ncbi:MAG: hypothetical protein E7565_00355 [Ruminococcaceae bacterium]|nr:hypothetical protein [Oscillospiraceae bacterium]
MKAILAILWIGALITMAIILPNMVSSGSDISVGTISIIGLISIILTFITFAGSGNNKSK